jgi:hypothetical protein
MRAQFALVRVLLSLILLVLEPSQAQSEKLRLKILEKGTGRSLGRAEVSMGSTKYYSDSEGLVEVEANISDDIRIYRNSFEVLTLSPLMTSAKSELTVYLFPSTTDDNEVIIRSMKRPETSKKTGKCDCGGDLKPLGAVQDPAEVRRYLKHCNIEYDPPPRGPPKLVQDSFEFDQAPLLDDYEAMIYND